MVHILRISLYLEAKMEYDKCLYLEKFVCWGTTVPRKWHDMKKIRINNQKRKYWEVQLAETRWQRGMHFQWKMTMHNMLQQLISACLLPPLFLAVRLNFKTLWLIFIHVVDNVLRIFLQNGSHANFFMLPSVIHDILELEDASFFSFRMIPPWETSI